MAYVRVERSGPEIRQALATAAPDTLAEFEAEFRIALAETDDDFDTSRIDRVLGNWWSVALLHLNPTTAAEKSLLDRFHQGEFAGLREGPTRSAAPR